MRATLLGKTQNSKELNAAIRPLREVDNHTNLSYLALDYLTLFAIVAPTILFYQQRASWGLSWLWNIPISAVAIALVGAVQHRLAGLGHEASHYVLLKNRFLNELVSDLFCMFPIFATTHQYRLVHLAHHQYTNDWEKDPDLLNIGKSKLMHQFPMTRWQFLYNYFFRFFWPPTLLRYLWDVVYLSAFGKGINPYLEGASHDEPNKVNVNLRMTSVLGIVYFFGMIAALAYFNHVGSGLLLALTGPAAWLTATVAILALPERAFFVSPLKTIYSAKFTAIVRLGCYTALLMTFAGLRFFTGQNWGAYFLLLWVVPLATSFAYLMLLRDVYQHANADDGKLTNSRVFWCDPLTRWAVFVYGMDIHVPHHMFPAVPHYNLRRLHEVLVEQNREYAEHVVECEGTFWNRSGRPTILDVMHIPTREDAAPAIAARSLADQHRQAG